MEYGDVVWFVDEVSVNHKGKRIRVKVDIVAQYINSAQTELGTICHLESLSHADFYHIAKHRLNRTRFTARIK